MIDFWKLFWATKKHSLVFLYVLLDLIASYPKGGALQGHLELLHSTTVHKEKKDSIYCLCSFLERQITEGIFIEFSPTMDTSMIQNNKLCCLPSFQTGPASAECWVILQHAQVLGFLSSEFLRPIDLFEFNVMFKGTAVLRAFHWAF